MDTSSRRNPLALLWVGVILLLSGVIAGVVPVGRQGGCGSALAPICTYAETGALTFIVWALIITGASAIIAYFVRTSRGESPTDVAVQIARLAELRSQGVLSEAEFQAAKARVLKPEGS